MGLKSYFREVWSMYTPVERRNIGLYILGIMFYKFGLEAFNGSITTLATDRFKATSTFKKLGVLQGLNQAFQCVGSICIAPLIKRFPTRTVLAGAIMGFAVLTAILLIVDGATGGELRRGGKTNKYGTWNPDALFPIYCASGIAYGMVELIRRVIPRDIVGGDVSKLRRMDATVHVFYEVAGTAGAITTTYLVLALGNNYSFIITPICFTFSCIVWLFISSLGHTREKDEKKSIVVQIGEGFSLFGKSIYKGGRTIFSSRKYIWLLPGYSFALYGHRYLENTISPLIAKRVFNESAYSQILVGGSNFGELLGAASVFFVNNAIPTPIPWLRFDSLMLLILWVTPYYFPPANDARYAWTLAAIFIPVSFAWAAGDVSLAAYIQSTLASEENASDDLSVLGAVMAFLYSTYIVLYAIINPVVGGYIDDSWTKHKDAHPALFNIAGVQFTVLCGIILAASCIPRGALRLNPKLLVGERMEGEKVDVEGREVDLEKEELKEGGASGSSVDSGFEGNVVPTAGDSGRVPA